MNCHQETKLNNHQLPSSRGQWGLHPCGSCARTCTTQKYGTAQKHKNMEQPKNTKIWNSSKAQKYGTAQKRKNMEQLKNTKIWNSSKTQKYGTAQKRKNMQQLKNTKICNQSKKTYKIIIPRQAMSDSWATCYRMRVWLHSRKLVQERRSPGGEMMEPQKSLPEVIQ